MLVGGSLYGTSSSESPWVQEFRLALEQLRFQMHSQEVEVQLVQDRAQALENSYKGLKEGSSSDKTLEKKISVLEKTQETLAADLKTLKTHLNETATTLLQCQAHLNKIDKQITSDIQSFKNSLNSMLTLLQPSSGDQKAYTVQAGDTLSQIALHHKVDLKTLKKINNLSSDSIFIGQKILLP